MERTERPSRPSSSPPRNRALVSSLLVALPALGIAQQPPVEQIVIGGMTPRFAVPACVPRKSDEASVAACRTIAGVLRDDLQFEGLFDFVPESNLKALPALNPDAVNFEDWKGIGARILVVTRAEVAKSDLTVEVQVYFVDSKQSMLAKRY